MPADSSPDRLRAATAALDRVRGDWLRHRGVTAVDVGLGDEGLALRVKVEDERAADRVADLLPEQLDGFPVVVLRARYGLHDEQSR